VHSQKNGEFSSRACEATLRWGQNELSVVPAAEQVDIDVLNADLGLGTPVVAFQIKNSASDPLMTYQIFSLSGPPHLLRTIQGGDFFSAADTNLEGRSEIWTGDAAAVAGFERLPLASFDVVPTVVLRFEKKRLIDVSSQFQPHFDRQIAELRSQLDSRMLSDFKNSDGKLGSIFPLPAEKLRLLQTTKIKVLEIVWAYLYSGRQEEAWRELATMWPTADFDRMRAAILSARAKGILTQVDGVAGPDSHPARKGHAAIFNSVSEEATHASTNTSPGDPLSANLEDRRNPPAEKSAGDASTVDIKPKPFFLRTLPTQGGAPVLPNSEVFLDLVIDAAGKVRSAQLVNTADKGPVGDSLISASAIWKFVPAFKDGHTVACRLRLSVAPTR
jgi:hypothetical protein